jgi:hypothetical protein
VQAIYVEFKGKGVAFIQPAKKEPWGEHAILRDSEGNMIVVGTA